MDLNLSTRHEGDRTVIEVGGEIDVYTAPKLREQLVDLVNQGRYHLVVDMEAVDFLDGPEEFLDAFPDTDVRQLDESSFDVSAGGRNGRATVVMPAAPVRLPV